MRGTLLSQYVFMEWCLVKHRDNFTLLIAKEAGWAGSVNECELGEWGDTRKHKGGTEGREMIMK